MHDVQVVQKKGCYIMINYCVVVNMEVVARIVFSPTKHYQRKDIRHIFSSKRWWKRLSKGQRKNLVRGLQNQLAPNK